MKNKMIMVIPNIKMKKKTRVTESTKWKRRPVLGGSHRWRPYLERVCVRVGHIQREWFCPKEKSHRILDVLDFRPGFARWKDRTDDLMSRIQRL